MKICLLGDCIGKIDEGMKKIAFQLGQELSRRYEVIILNPKSAFHADFWVGIKEFAPNVVHYIPGPSIKSFAVMQAISLVFPAASTIMSAPLPLISNLTAKFIRFLKPDLVLAQSRRMEDTFRQWGLATTFLPLSGVDVHRFRPASSPVKQELRKKYAIGQKQFVALHVGHLKSKRNVQFLRKMQKDGIQTVVVGSTSTGIESDLRDNLTAVGCLVITEFVARIDELYRLSDCYVFPTPTTSRSACIELPLSVLEAASCNLPVVSTRFGALPEIFDSVDGFVLVESEEQILQAVEEIKYSGMEIRTRGKALSFSWENIAQALDEIYEELSCS